MALVPLLNIEMRSARAAEKVPVDDPTAKALKYVEDATQAQRVEKMGVAADQQFCDNCIFYTTAAEADGYGPCTIFANRLVTKKGWCAGWTPKQ